LKKKELRTLKKYNPVFFPDGKAFKSNQNYPVLLCGDSYSVAFRGGNLAAHISKEIGMPIDMLVQSGGGPAIPKLLAGKGKDYLKKKRVIIWAFVARYLPSKNWSNICFPKD
jgi:hypothetical protein